MLIKELSCHYYVLPDYRIIATDYTISEELIRGGGSDDGDLIDSFKEGEVRRELNKDDGWGYEGQLEGEWEIAFYYRDPLAFAFESGIALFDGFKILEATHEYIIAQSKIVIEGKP